MELITEYKGLSENQLNRERFHREEKNINDNLFLTKYENLSENQLNRERFHREEKNINDNLFSTKYENLSEIRENFNKPSNSILEEDLYIASKNVAENFQKPSNRNTEAELYIFSRQLENHLNSNNASEKLNVYLNNSDINTLNNFESDTQVKEGVDNHKSDSYSLLIDSSEKISKLLPFSIFGGGYLSSEVVYSDLLDTKNYLSQNLIANNSTKVSSASLINSSFIQSNFSNYSGVKIELLSSVNSLNSLNSRDNIFESKKIYDKYNNVNSLIYGANVLKSNVFTTQSVEGVTIWIRDFYDKKSRVNEHSLKFISEQSTKEDNLSNITNIYFNGSVIYKKNKE